MIGYVAGGIGAAVLAGVGYQLLGVRRDRKRFPPPGKFVAIGNRRLHVRDMGKGSPTVLLESGLMSTVLTWQGIQPELAKSTRVVSYDRAGLGWSDPGPEPRNASRIVDELHSLLTDAQIAPPYVVVGHSYGGLTMSLFAARYPGEVCGVVLVDPVAPAEWHPPSEHDRRRVEIGSIICRRAAVVSYTGLLRLIAWLIHSNAKSLANPLIRAISQGAPSDSNSTESRWFWNLPAGERAVTPFFWTQAKFCRTIASQLERLPESAGQVVAAGPLETRLTVISAANLPSRRLAEHRAVAAQSSEGHHILAKRSGHWITEDQPELVVAAILEIVEGARSRTESPASSRRLT
ncbi:MAG TPA: alpha/beta hydrolase [Candidatus Acidoferrales bacterium]|nr:alpha/beta hydrolase [Candidatus Acidoferrales bacterium]